MNAGRWYPTATVLTNGDVLVVSGSIDNTVGGNRLPQVFQVGSGTWRDLTSAQLGHGALPDDVPRAKRQGLQFGTDDDDPLS